MVSLPSVEEQRAIGEYLEYLDTLITLHQREESCATFFSFRLPMSKGFLLGTA